jgi:hypothetical protein
MSVQSAFVDIRPEGLVSDGDLILTEILRMPGFLTFR